MECFRSHGALRALRRGGGGAVSLLSLVRGATAQEDRRVLHAASARRREGLTRYALSHRGSARPLQRLERERRRGGRGVSRRARGLAGRAIPTGDHAAGVSARRSSTGSRKTTSSYTLENGMISGTP